VKLVSYRPDGDRPFAPGILSGDRVVPARSAAEAAGLPAPMVRAAETARGILGLDADERAALLGAVAQAAGASSVAADDVELGPPIPDPQKIICLGLNYRDHAEESGLTPPDAPMFFAKFANSLVGPQADIRPPATTEKVDYEAEMAVVIGRRGRDIAPADALAYVAGIMALNDVSARDLQLANTLWTGGKAIDTFAPCGPALVTLDELDRDLGSLGLRARVNGELVQDGTTADLIFGVETTIAFLSQIMTLEVGDIIATGTPAGVGQSRTPPLFLTAGDVVEVDLDGVGTLRNTVVRPG
jgi:2-keto-4-pentenoate hydratase/2-oxohepta-3-ene-1,7-dioic acid hydratase in catechol pathway